MLTLNDLTPGSVVIDNRGKIAVITGIAMNYPANPVLFVYASGGTKYKGPVSGFKAVVGSVDLAKFNQVGEPVVSTVTQNFQNFNVPAELRDIKIGDKILVRTNESRNGEVVIFNGYKANRPKYPLTYTLNGRQYKGVMSSFIGKA